MITIFLFVASLLYACKHGSLAYFSIFQILVIIAIGIYVVNDVDVMYKINTSLPSDTRLYYDGYMFGFEHANNYLFSEYPLFLRIITFPIVSSLYATWGQSVLLYFLLDLIVKNKSNLLLFIFFHALIYVCTNMFKDNMICVTSLCGFLLLRSTKNVWLQCVVVLLSILLIAMIRPFMGYIIPICFFPLVMRIKSSMVKNVLLGGAVVCVACIVYLQRNYILGVMNSFSEDAALSEGRSSFIVALFKIVFGPTPSHYLYSKQYFSQPFLPEQSFYFAILHYAYYLSFAFLSVYIIGNVRRLLNIYKVSIAKLFLLFVATAQMIVYIVIYGSADIRQRAVILTLIFVYVLPDKSFWVRKMSTNQFLLFVSVLSVLILLDIIT